MDANGAKSRIWVSHRFCIESGTLSGTPPPRKVRPGWWSKDLVTGARGRRWQVIQLLGCQPKKIRIDCEKVRPLQQMNPAKKIPARKGPVTFKKLNSDSRPWLRREAPQRRPAHRGAPQTGPHPCTRSCKGAAVVHFETGRAPGGMPAAESARLAGLRRVYSPLAVV
jgi:hypothetical protein